MAGFIGTFKRKEKKYVLAPGQAEMMKRLLSDRLQLDEYGETRIDSLYFDTPDRSLIARSLEKPIYKEKLRVRAYGDAQIDSPVFVEIKKKFKGIVYKRRVRMSRAGAAAFLSGESFEEAQRRFPIAGCGDAAGVTAGGDAAAAGVTAIDRQIAHEIDAFISRYESLEPSMVVSCMREAWKAIDPDDPESDVRVTFDRDISYVDVAGERFDYDDAVRREGRDFVLTGGKVLMEVKCAGAYPLWLVQLLDECGVKPQSFSKYGNAYQITGAPQRVTRGGAVANGDRVRPRGDAGVSGDRVRPQGDAGVSGDRVRPQAGQNGGQGKKRRFAAFWPKRIAAAVALHA